MEKHLSSDKPIALKEEDKFQRYNFSQRIAKTIIDRESEDCIVIGIYGAWGEGKTSVINFIETELKQDDQTIIIKFNPWRYGDENSLLLQFFNKLAAALNVRLKTNKEKVGELLHKYGKLININIPFIGDAGDTIQSAGELLGEVDIETLKSRISEIIKQNNNKIVVFIDDIDRLDKNEIHSIFRLVKLTADFSSTTYILSFDELMVSAAIGERFGEGNQKAGQSFLEKIIQVPLKIPVAQPDALKQFCFELIDKSLNSSNICLYDEEVRRFVSEFTDSILVKLDTPRLAVRYGNTLSFALPLLYGEVNIVDLMLIEAIKIFYPNFYEFIKSNPEYFIGSYSEWYSQGKDTEKIKQIKVHFENLTNSLSRRQASGVQNLLSELFPKLKEAFDNYSFTRESENEWFKNKRIASPKYFNRYFTYAVIKGEISDIAFKNLIDSITSQEESESIEAIKELVSQSSSDNFIQKIRSLEDDFTWETSIGLAKAISKTSEIFSSKSRNIFTLSLGSTNSQAAIFIYKLIKNHKNREEGFQLALQLERDAQPIDFAFELNRWFRTGDSQESKLFKVDQYVELGKLLLTRTQEEAGNIPIFIKFPERSSFIYSIWSETDKVGLESYIKGLLAESPELSIKLLSAFTPVIMSSSYPEAYRSNFTRNQYDFFISLFDKEVIKQHLIVLYGAQLALEQGINWEEDDGPYQTDLNIIKQFLHWEGVIPGESRE